jgi:UDPglucose 6-dehydrogenase
MIDADALVLLTEWNEFRALDLSRIRELLRKPVMVDLRNVYQPDEMTAAGFIYHSIGRSTAEPSTGISPNLRAIA